MNKSGRINQNSSLSNSLVMHDCFLEYVFRSWILLDNCFLVIVDVVWIKIITSPNMVFDYLIGKFCFQYKTVNEGYSGCFDN